MHYDYKCSCGYMSRYETDTKAPLSIQCHKCKSTVQRKGEAGDGVLEKEESQVTVDTTSISTNTPPEQPVKRKRGRPPKVR